MINSRLLSLFTSRLYFLFSGKAFHLEENLLVESNKERLEKTIFPVIVIGREHYRESSKKYPVTNEKDLRQILVNESDEAHIISPPIFKEDHALLQTYELDNTALDFVSNQWCFWFPETWLLNIQSTQLLQVNRGGNCVWGTSLSGNLYSTVASGAFASPDYFLMSIGASSDIQENIIPNESYSKLVVEGLNGLSSKQWRELAKAQKYIPKLNKLFSWPSIIAGLLLGYGIFCLADLVALSYQHRSIDKKISQQEVSSVIQKQRALETKAVALSALANISSDKVLIRNMWQSVLALMEGKHNILRIVLEGNKLQIRIESENANDALALVQGLDYVETADFSTPVRNSAGNKRVTIAIGFKNEDSNDG
jgi:hypothetical protein